MAYLAVDKCGEEWIYDSDFEPYRENDCWDGEGFYVQLPKCTIKKLTGKEFTWEDEPIELTEKSLTIESLKDKLISIRQKRLKYYKERCEDCPQLEGHEDIRQEILDAFYQGAVEAYID